MWLYDLRRQSLQTPCPVDFYWRIEHCTLLATTFKFVDPTISALTTPKRALQKGLQWWLNPRRNTHWKLEVSGRRFYLTNHLANIYIFRINKRNTRKRREISSKLTIKAPERRQCHPSRVTVKGALSGLRQFLSTESPLKLMKNAFYFTSKALFVLKILKFFSWLFGHVAKRLDK